MFGRGGPFGSIFGGDPFFSNAFSNMDRMMNSMLSDPFFGNPLGPAFHPPIGHVPQQGPQPRNRQPVIEEVDDAGQPVGTGTAQDDPIVEEPDDDAEGSTHNRAAQRPRHHSPARSVPAPLPTSMDPFGQLFGAFGGAGAGNGGSSLVFSSSSYSSMSPGGVSYQASSTTRVGPGGVRETQAVVRDGRSGKESVTISRGLGDGRQRTLVRTRDAMTGREEQLEDLKGLAEHEADTFDDQWRRQAERNLPGGGALGAAVGGRLGGAANGRQSAPSQRRLALPSTTGNAGTALYDGGAGVPPPRANYASHAPSAPQAPGAGSRSRQATGTAHYTHQEQAPPGGRASYTAAPAGPPGSRSYGGGARNSSSGIGGEGAGGYHRQHGSGRATYGNGGSGAANQGQGRYHY